MIEGFDSDLISLQEVWEPHDGSSLASHAEHGGYQLFHTPLAPSLVHPAPEITADLDRAHAQEQ